MALEALKAILFTTSFITNDILYVYHIAVSGSFSDCPRAITDAAIATTTLLFFSTTLYILSSVVPKNEKGKSYDVYCACIYITKPPATYSCGVYTTHVHIP